LVSRVATRLGRDVIDVRQRADLVFEFGDLRNEAG
jgi:hypothetical protein